MEFVSLLKPTGIPPLVGSKPENKDKACSVSQHGRCLRERFCPTMSLGSLRKGLLKLRSKQIFPEDKFTFFMILCKVIPM